jgi:hypothetical protein
MLTIRKEHDGIKLIVKNVDQPRGGEILIKSHPWELIRF